MYCKKKERNENEIKRDAVNRYGFDSSFKDFD